MGKYDNLHYLTARFNNTSLQAVAGDTLPLETLFPTNDQDTISADAYDNIQLAIIELLERQCTRTTDKSHLPTLVLHMPISWTNSNDSRRSIRPNKLEQIVNEFIAESNSSTLIGSPSVQELIIDIDCNNLFYDPTFNGFNMNHVSHVPTSHTTTTTPTRSTTSLPAALSGGIYTTPPTDVFNIHALPSDVKIRYDAHQNPSITLRPQDFIPFVNTTGPHTSYYHDPSLIGQRVILLNGAVLEGTRDTKTFLREIPACNKDTPTGLRTWYRTFTQWALSNGIYVVPFDLVTKGHGQHNGFEFGIDLPDGKSTEYFHWQQAILQAISKSHVFPTDSLYRQIAKASHNGYYALQALLHQAHPSHKEMESELTLTFPKQTTSQNIFEFYEEFEDFVNLRNLIHPGSESMASKNMIDTFIICCIESAYLKHASRYDRTDPIRRTWFEPGTLALTCNTYISSAPKHLLQTRGTHRNNWDNKSNYDNKSSNLNAYPSSPFRKKINSLLGIDCATDTPPETTLDQVVAQLITADTKNPTCLLCRDDSQPHRWTECPYIQDGEFNKSISIRLASLLNRTMKESQRRKNTDQKRINSLLQDMENKQKDIPSDEEQDKKESKDQTVFPPGNK
jgi:hypothetical protein